MSSKGEVWIVTLGKMQGFGMNEGPITQVSLKPKPSNWRERPRVVLPDGTVVPAQSTVTIPGGCQYEFPTEVPKGSSLMVDEAVVLAVGS